MKDWKLGHKFKCKALEENKNGLESEVSDKPEVLLPAPLVYLFDPKVVTSIVQDSLGAVDLPLMNKGLINKIQNCYLNSVLQ